jgi:hypothetical protein
VAEPFGLGFLVCCKPVSEMKQHTKIVDGVNVEGHSLCKGSHARTTICVRWQKRWLRKSLIQPFHDGKRLRQHQSIWRDERWHQPLRIEIKIVSLALVAFAQAIGFLDVVDAFEIECDTNAKRCRRTPKAMQHKSRFYHQLRRGQRPQECR